MDEESNKYNQLIGELDNEKKELEKEIVSARSLKQKEKLMLEKLDEFKKTINEFSGSIEKKDKQIYSIEKHVHKIEDSIDNLKEDVLEGKDKFQKIIANNKENEQKILKVQNDLILKVKERKSDIEGAIKHSGKLSSKFKKFFEKKSTIENLLVSMEKEIIDLKTELSGLLEKSKVFSIASKDSDVKSYILKLEKKLKTAEKKRDDFKSKMVNLINLISK